MKKIIFTFGLLINVLAYSAQAQAFVVRNIEIDGLQRISSETVYSYLPIKRGQTLNESKTAAIIKDLYKTGFFDSVSLERRGDTLVINVAERSTIGVLKITGNSAIATDKLTTVMKSLDIAEGRVYNRAMIDRIQQSLLNQYYELGRYNARVNVTATPMSRNRMLVKIDISEGLVAKIRKINIIGNHVFSESRLENQLTVSTPGLFTFITQSDRYSQEKLDESIESLRNFYLDHGYIKFNVVSTQVEITPDRKSIILVISVDEGVPYTIEGVDLSGDLILSREELMKQIKVKPGQTFSRQKLIDTEKGISQALGDKGYVGAVVSVNPRINDQTKQVFLTFDIKPGKRTYVRHIYFSDNTKTNDEVLRRALVQMESGVVSTSRLEESKHNLSLLPYIKDVQMSVEPVEGTDDQVDINYKVKEDNAAQATATIGYSQQYGIQLGAGINQKNFLGTGKTLGFNLTKNHYEQLYGINYTNPYYTPDGVSRTLGASFSKVDPGEVNGSASYTLNQYTGSVLYGIPVGQEKDVVNTVSLGYGYEASVVNLTHTVSNQIQNFVNANGRHFGQLDLISGYTRNSLDKTIFPTRGMLHNIGGSVYLPGGSGDLTYYMANYTGRLYVPLSESFIIQGKAQLGYGNSFRKPQDFPFFKNYYAGGIDSVRGYLGNSLGPKDSFQKPTGGNVLATGTVALIFPNYISENFRTSIFVDGGNVYNTFNNRSTGGFPSGPMRYSSGIEGDWLTMFGLIEVSLAKPINRQHGNGVLADSEEPFQFSLGANF